MSTDPQILPVKLGSYCTIYGQEWVATGHDKINDEIRFSALIGNKHFKKSISDVSDWVNSGKVEFRDRVSCLHKLALVSASLNDIERTAWLRRSDYTKAVRSLGNGAPKALAIKTVKALFEKRKATLPSEVEPNISTIYKWKRRVDDNHGLYAALAFREHRHLPRAMRIHPEVEEVIKEGIKEVYLEDVKTSYLNVYDWVTNELGQINADRNLRGEDALHMPSKTTIRNRIVAHNKIDRDEAREGVRYIRKHYNYGGKTEYAEHIGSRIEADTTYIDCFVYDPILDITYKPELLVMLECATRCVVGYELSYIPKGSEKVMLAVADMVRRDERTGFGCIPDYIVVDNGKEFDNKSLKLFCENTGVVMDFATPYTPNGKAMIERFFGTLNSLLIHKLSGTTKGSVIERGYYESEEHTTYTLEELREKLDVALDIYHLKNHTSLNCSPKTKWDLLEEQRAPDFLDYETAMALGSHTVQRTIQTGGRIEIDNLFWYSPELPQILDAVLEKGEKVTIAYNPSDLTYAWVIHPRDPERIIRCEPVNRAYQSGLTLTLHNAILEQYRNLEIESGNPERARAMRVGALKELLDDARNSIHKKKKGRARIVDAVRKELDQQMDNAQNETGAVEKTSAHNKSPKQDEKPTPRATDFTFIN